MAILKYKEIKNMSEKECSEKMQDLKRELVKNKVSANSNTKLKIREIKRTIAKLHTFNRQRKESAEQ